VNFLFTRWLYPLQEPIVLLKEPYFALDNPRFKEIKKIASLFEENYQHQLRYFLPPSAGDKYISLDWIISRFRDNFSSSDRYVKKVLAKHNSDFVFESLARIWIIARYDDEGTEKKLEQSAKRLFKKGQKGLFLLEDDHPIIRNSDKLWNYLSLLSLLIHSQVNHFIGNPILINSENNYMQMIPFDEHHWRHALINFLVFASDKHEKDKLDSFAWNCFPYVRERLINVKDTLERAFSNGYSDLLMYIGNILRVVEHDVHDIRVRFVLLISLLELLVTHNPDTSRYNVEDSINRQFKLKTGMLIRLQYPETNLNELENRLKQLYSLRSAIAHGDFKAIANYKKGLCKKKGKEEYFDSIVSDAYFYLRAVLEQFLRDPDFVQFIKKS
jgi:hypothetical protein